MVHISEQMVNVLDILTYIPLFNPKQVEMRWFGRFSYHIALKSQVYKDEHMETGRIYFFKKLST